jgi:hypothetical protein
MLASTIPHSGNGVTGFGRDQTSGIGGYKPVNCCIRFVLLCLSDGRRAQALAQIDGTSFGNARRRTSGVPYALAQWRGWRSTSSHSLSA